MERKSKSQIVQIIVIIVLSVLLVVSLGLGATFAWFSNQNSASATMTMGGKIIIKLQDSDSRSATFVEERGLIPGMNVTSDVNIMISQSNTPCFVRAKFDIEVDPKDDTFELSNNSKNQIIETFNEGILKMINDTGNIYFESIKFNTLEQNYGDGYGQIINSGAKWYLYDGWFYLVAIDQDEDAIAEDPANAELVNVSTYNASTVLTFVKGNFNLPGLEWGNDLKDCNITFDITAQAVQIFQKKHDGEERPIYHNEPIDVALQVFGEALDPRIEFYSNGGEGTIPTMIVPDEDLGLVVGDMVELPGADLVKDGLSFICWNTREDGNGTNYYAGDKIRLSAARKRLYAVYGTPPADPGS